MARLLSLLESLLPLLLPPQKPERRRLRPRRARMPPLPRTRAPSSASCACTCAGSRPGSSPSPRCYTRTDPSSAGTPRSAPRGSRRRLPAVHRSRARGTRLRTRRTSAWCLCATVRARAYGAHVSACAGALAAVRIRECGRAPARACASPWWWAVATGVRETHKHTNAHRRNTRRRGSASGRRATTSPPFTSHALSYSCLPQLFQFI